MAAAWHICHAPARRAAEADYLYQLPSLPMFVVHIHSKNGVPRTENAYAAHHGFTQLGCHVQLFETQAALRHNSDCSTPLRSYLKKFAFKPIFHTEMV